MKKIIIAPDSFKGTMSAKEVCDIISKAVKDSIAGAELYCIPMSDGGEGMVSSYLELLGGQAFTAKVSGPKGKAVDCPYGILPDGTAVAEMAGCAGLMLMEGELDPLNASTRGVGELFGILKDKGCKKLLLGIGGSATNDCGVGMAHAMGFKFLDNDGREVKPYAKNIARICDIIKPEKPFGLSITVACDVNNPLCGINGASYIFGPQKGLKPEQIAPLDDSIKSFADLIEQKLGVSVENVPGAGAAGGLGAALMAFCGAELKPGIELLLDVAHFDMLAQDADLIITGEGRLDIQSISGKVPVGVGRRAKVAGTDCIAICGCTGKGAEAAFDEGIKAIYPCSDGTESFEEIKKNCRNALYETSLKALRKYYK